MRPTLADPSRRQHVRDTRSGPTPSVHRAFSGPQARLLTYVVIEKAAGPDVLHERFVGGYEGSQRRVIGCAVHGAPQHGARGRPPCERWLDGLVHDVRMQAIDELHELHPKRRQPEGWAPTRTSQRKNETNTGALAAATHAHPPPACFVQNGPACDGILCERPWQHDRRQVGACLQQTEDELHHAAQAVDLGHGHHHRQWRDQLHPLVRHQPRTHVFDARVSDARVSDAGVSDAGVVQGG